MLKNYLIPSVLLIAGCTSTPPKPQIKPPIRGSGPDVIFKTESTPKALASCLMHHWNQETPDKPDPITRPITYDAPDENGVLHRYVRQEIDDRSTDSLYGKWERDNPPETRREYGYFEEAWGYTVYGGHNGSKMADIYKESSYSVVRFYYPKLTEFEVVTAIDKKYDPLFDAGIDDCVKHPVAQPNPNADKWDSLKIFAIYAGIYGLIQLLHK